MKLTFHGAAREVTGSCHRLEVDGRSVLLDCGLIQGGKERHERNRAPFPFDVQRVDAVVLSHAHIDHSGRLPLLRRNGYRGPIYATRATTELAKILLTDSARIHEEDARWKIKRLKKKNQDWKWVQPLYTEEDAKAALKQFVPVDFRAWFDIPKLGRARFLKAGHILGAGIVELETSGGKRLVFSGDLGVDGARLLGPPRSIECPDYLLIESTYGDRRRGEVEDRTDQLERIVRATLDRNGKLLIPAFAVGRTQEVLARINDLVESGRIPRVPVYVDSPMAVRATSVFGMFPEAFSEKARRLLKAGDEPLDFPGLELVVDVEESKAINASREPCIVISASGMCTAGRIKHHLAHGISNPNNTVLFVGYQAHGSLGRVIKNGTTPVRIFGDWYDVQARIEEIDGFSAHADLDELLAWYDCLDGKPERTFVVHGEEKTSLAFADRLRESFDARVDVPERDQSFELDG